LSSQEKLTFDDCKIISAHRHFLHLSPYAFSLYP
jgi:hypothetical protein